jgi:hypothetical protein
MSLLSSSFSRSMLNYQKKMTTQERCENTPMSSSFSCNYVVTQQKMTTTCLNVSSSSSSSRFA